MNDSLPKDPYILLSFVNTRLRDCYPDLKALCDDLDISRKELEDKLEAADFRYNPATNQFV